MGGDVPSGTTNTAELFDPSKGTFAATGSMVEKRQFFAAVTLADGNVLVIGGDRKLAVGWAYSATAELYDPATQTFTLTGSMSRARDYHTATTLSGGKVLVNGGYGETGGTETAEIYDPALGTFSPTGSMAIKRAWSHRSTALATGQVLVTGGADRDIVSLAIAELYDPITGKFSPAGRMAIARGNHTATLLGDGSVLVAGGEDRPAKFASAELYRLAP